MTDPEIEQFLAEAIHKVKKLECPDEPQLEKTSVLLTRHVVLINELGTWAKYKDEFGEEWEALLKGEPELTKKFEDIVSRVEKALDGVHAEIDRRFPVPRSSGGVVVELAEGEACGFYCPALGRAVESCGMGCVGSVCRRLTPEGS